MAAESWLLEQVSLVLTWPWALNDRLVWLPSAGISQSLSVSQSTDTRAHTLLQHEKPRGLQLLLRQSS